MTASLDTTASLLAALRTVLATLSQPATSSVDVALARQVARAAIDKHGGDAHALAMIEQREIPEVELNALCESAGIRLVRATEDEVAGMWDWIHDGANEACDQSFTTRAAAAMDALSSRFKEDWEYQVASGCTRRGLLDWIGSEALA